MGLKNFTVIELKSNLLPTDKIFIGVKAQEYIENNCVDASTVLIVKETVRNFCTELVLQLVQRFDFGRDDIKSHRLMLFPTKNLTLSLVSKILIIYLTLIRTQLSLSGSC